MSIQQLSIGFVPLIIVFVVCVVEKLLQIRLQAQPGFCFKSAVRMKCWTFVSEWELTATVLDKRESGIASSILSSLYLDIKSFMADAPK